VYRALAEAASPPHPGPCRALQRKISEPKMAASHFRCELSVLMSTLRLSFFIPSYHRIMMHRSGLDSYEMRRSSTENRVRSFSERKRLYAAMTTNQTCFVLHCFVII
jgi:hypothetical protein